MRFNTIQTDHIFQQIATLEQRVNALQAMVQGAPIDSIRIKDASITAAKIEDGSITTAKIDDGAITNAKVANLSADKVTAGTIAAARIGANSITAAKLNVSTLSAITANFGTVTAGSINGTTITSTFVGTSLGNDRVYFGGSQFGFLQGGSFDIAIQDNLFYLYGAGLGFAELGATSSRGLFGISSSTGNVIYGSTQVDLILFQTLGTDIFIGDVSSGDIYFEGTFQINGSTKTAIVPTSKGYKALYCVEAPEVWFMDIVESLNKVDPLFWEVTEGDYKTVTNKAGEILLFRRRKRFATMRFEPKTKKDFIRNNRLWGKYGNA